MKIVKVQTRIGQITFKQAKTATGTLFRVLCKGQPPMRIKKEWGVGWVGSVGGVTPINAKNPKECYRKMVEVWAA